MTSSPFKLPVGEMLAEFLGTMVLLMLGDGVVAMVKLFGTGVPGEVVNGGYTNITLGWGLGVLMGVCIAGKVSGAHLNPAVTLTLWVARGFPTSKLVPYISAQMAGAFVGAALVYLNYYPAFQEFDPTLAKTEGIFTTFPAYPNNPLAGLVDQILGTALLLALILAITDPRNEMVAPGIQPFAIALVVVAIGISWGKMHGYAINPARDLGPRLFITAAGFQNTGFGTSAWWVPIVGPCLGGLIGAFVYDLGIRRFLPPR